MKWKKRLSVLALSLCLVLSACGASADEPKPTAATQSGLSGDMPGEADYAPAAADNIAGKGIFPAPGGGYAGVDAKMILQAQFSIQTTDFSAASAALEQLVTSLGGYFESSGTQAGSYYDKSAMRYAYYTVRLPSGAFTALSGRMDEVGHVASSSSGSTDVGAEYYDAEVRLNTLRTKNDRLLALLEKASAMTDIIELENALSNTQYEIDCYSSTLKRYDGLVDYATVRVDLSEVLKITDDPGQAAPLGTRVAAAFSAGLSGFADAAGNLFVWAAYHFAGLAILAAALIIGGRFALRALRKKRRDEIVPKSE